MTGTAPSTDVLKFNSPDEFLLSRVGSTPSSSIGWFRAGVAFYNKRHFKMAIDCFDKSVELDPMNYNAYQVMARACIAMNRRDDAIKALKESVKLDNPSDWQLLIELSGGNAGKHLTNAAFEASGAPTSTGLTTSSPSFDDEKTSH